MVHAGAALFDLNIYRILIRALARPETIQVIPLDSASVAA